MKPTPDYSDALLDKLDNAARTQTNRDFLRPTLVGVGIGSGSFVLLVFLLMMFAMLSHIGSGGASPLGTFSAGSFDDHGAGVLNNDGAGDGETADDARHGSPAETDTAPVEVSVNAGDELTNDVPITAEQEEPDRKTDTLAPFVIAALPKAGEGEGESRGGGEGFSDVEERLAREGAQSGDVQISLAWNNFNDLDLHVVAPSGERIFFGHKRSQCRGELDVDMNAGRNRSNRPVENIFWPTDGAPGGEYIVVVDHYANHGGRDPTAYQVVVKVGDNEQRFSGRLTHGQRPQTVHQFQRN